MQPVDTFVALYLIGVMVVLGVLSVLAYRKQKKNGEIEDEKKDK